MRLSELWDVVPGAARFDFRDRDITGLTCDSRDVTPGACFIAVAGEREDGARYLPDALARGAAAVVAGSRPAQPLPVPLLVAPDVRAAASRLASRFHGDPSARMAVVGITGTKGKTTSAFLMRSIFEAAGKRCGLLGTVEFAVGRRIVPAPQTTPGPVEIQRYLAEMAADGCGAAVMEVSSHALVHRRVDAVRFRAAVLTNLAQDHLDFHKTPEAYREAKGSLFRMLAPDAVAVLNRDDASAPFYRSLSKSPVWEFGVGPGAGVRADIGQVDFRGTRFLLTASGRSVPIVTPFMGRHNVYNMLAAAATGLALGIDLDTVKRGIEALKAVPGRLEPVACGQGFAVMVDYAHTEDALRNVLACLRPLTKGRLICVFGCGGDRDRGKRPKMGRAAEELADVVVLTSDNPRSEDPEAILAEIRSVMKDAARAQVCVDRREAIERAVAQARTGDIVLIAGKGHETYQIFRTETKPFDDRVVAREALMERVARR